MPKSINLIFPHQLFLHSPLLDNGFDIYLVEEYLFFKQYKFHKQKLAFHRATMKYYQQVLEQRGLSVYYIECYENHADMRQFSELIQREHIQHIHVINPCDDWLEQRITALEEFCEISYYDNPQFLNTREELEPFFRKDKRSYFQTSFYKQQRKQRNILMCEDGKPQGGHWTYDKENRKKYPKSKLPPTLYFPEASAYWNEAVQYVDTHFADHYGDLGEQRYYPINHEETNAWLEQFLTYRFYNFGAYEDAILREHIFLNHSVLSPLINVGLILPDELLT